MAEHNESHATHDAHGEAHHVNYKKIYLTLLGLLVISVVGPFFGIVWVTLITAFGIAIVKANLVIQNFMHLKWEANWKYVLTVPASIMSIFLLLMLIPDIGLRTRNYADDRWLYAAEPEMPHVEERHEGALHDAAHPRAEEGGEGRSSDKEGSKKHATEGASKHGS